MTLAPKTSIEPKNVLESDLFTSPPDTKLDACLARDAGHIFQGAVGDHVAKIQEALNRLSAGPGRENFNLAVDGKYGPETAKAVKRYKDTRGNILGPGQTSADNIVGRRTITSLDDEMSILENEVPLSSVFVSTTALSPIAHPHEKCPPNNSLGAQSGGRCHHFGTPIFPLGLPPGSKKLNFGGEGETDYLGFLDVMPNRFGIEPRNRPLRPLTSTLPDKCASDIFMRFSPILKDGSVEKGKNEIIRLAAPGCRMTFCGLEERFIPVMLTLGRVIELVRMKNFIPPFGPNDKDIDTFVLVRP